MKFSEQFTAFKYPVNMLPKVQDVLDARGRERGGLNHKSEKIESRLSLTTPLPQKEGEEFLKT